MLHLEAANAIWSSHVDRQQKKTVNYGYNKSVIWTNFNFLPEKLGAHPISQFRLPNNVGSKRLLEIFNNLAQSSFELFKFHENSKDDFQLKIA